MSDTDNLIKGFNESGLEHFSLLPQDVAEVNRLLESVSAISFEQQAYTAKYSPMTKAFSKIGDWLGAKLEYEPVNHSREGLTAISAALIVVGELGAAYKKRRSNEVKHG